MIEGLVLARIGRLTTVWSTFCKKDDEVGAIIKLVIALG